VTVLDGAVTALGVPNEQTRAVAGALGELRASLERHEPPPAPPATARRMARCHRPPPT
jgi:hypothetical protein